MRTRLDVSGSTSTTTFKLCRNWRHDSKSSRMMSLWLTWLATRHKMRTWLDIFKLWMDCNILVFSNLEPWNSNFINDIIVSRGLVQFKDQTQNEDHTWYLRFYMYHKMLSCQTCRHEKRICQLMSSWLSRGLDSLYWPDTKWGPELISQLWNFIRLVGIKKEIYIYDVSMTVTFLS